MPVDFGRAKLLLDKAKEYVDRGEMEDFQYEALQNAVNEVIEKHSPSQEAQIQGEVTAQLFKKNIHIAEDENDDGPRRGPFETVGETVGDIAKHLLIGGTLVENFLTAGIGTWNDIISFFLALKAPAAGAWVGRKIDKFLGLSPSERSARYNMEREHVYILDEYDRSTIENVLLRFASLNNINNVESVTIEVTPQTAIVQFKQADIMGSFLGNLLGRIFGIPGIAQYIGNRAQDLMQRISSNEPIDWAEFFGESIGDAIGSYIGNRIGSAIGIPGIGQYLLGNLGEAFGGWLVNLLRGASSRNEVQEKLVKIATDPYEEASVPSSVRANPDYQRLMEDIRRALPAPEEPSGLQGSSDQPQGQSVD